MTDGAAAGVWLVDKPEGPTSHDVVAGIRHRIGGARVGHAGTLDPFATGLLVLLVGRATRLAQYLVGLDKTYDATIRLGATSVTLDPEGPITPTGRRADPEAVDGALAALRGRGRQRVPQLSAVRVGGERLYRRARRGLVDDERPERDVTITELVELDRDPRLEWMRVRVSCSSGTYVRVLASDLGDALGSGGYCSALRRTHVGHLDVRHSVAPGDVAREGGVDPVDALRHLDRLDLDAETAALVAHGRDVPCRPGGSLDPIALVHGGRLVAVGRGRGDRIHPEVVLT